MAQSPEHPLVYKMGISCCCCQQHTLSPATGGRIEVTDKLQLDSVQPASSLVHIFFTFFALLQLQPLYKFLPGPGVT